MAEASGHFSLDPLHALQRLLMNCPLASPRTKTNRHEHADDRVHDTNIDNNKDSTLGWGKWWCDVHKSSEDHLHAAQPQ